MKPGWIVLIVVVIALVVVFPSFGLPLTLIALAVAAVRGVVDKVRYNQIKKSKSREYDENNRY